MLSNQGWVYSTTYVGFFATEWGRSLDPKLSWWMPSGQQLGLKVQNSGEHGHYSWGLFLCWAEDQDIT